MFQHKFRFPAQNRLDHPQTLFSQSFILKFSPNQLPHSRFGVFVSKKIAKNAVPRNQLKRRLRSCLEYLHPQIPPGHDFIFILRPAAKEKTKEELSGEIKNCLYPKLMLK